MSRKPKDRGVLEGKIGHKFAEQALLERALTHISAVTGGGPQNRSGSYQRLEFLGDHVLGLVISEMLYQAYPRACAHSCNIVLESRSERSGRSMRSFQNRSIIFCAAP